MTESNRYSTFHIGKSMEANMKVNEECTKTEEAELTLKTLEKLQGKVIESAQPPIWLNALLTLTIGGALWLRIYTYPTGHPPALLFLAGTIIFLIALWAHRCRNLGLAPKILPTNFRGLIFQLSQLVFFLGIFLGARYLYENGMLWAGNVGIALIVIVISYLFHNYPTNEWIQKEGKK